MTKPQRRRLGPTTDIIVQSELWGHRPEAAATVRRAIAMAADLCDAPAGEVSVVLTDDRTIRGLNREWRGRDTATNVLSFPAAGAGAAPSAPAPLGDIVIAYETLLRESTSEQKSFLAHLAHLSVHGFLHLLGYDHTSDREAETMENLERAILRQLGVPDPYAAAAPARVINRG